MKRSRSKDTKQDDPINESNSTRQKTKGTIVHASHHEQQSSAMQRAVAMASSLHLNGLQKQPRRITIERLEKFTQSGQFEDVNMRTFLYKHKSSDCVTLSVCPVPDLKRVSFKEGTAVPFKPTKVGESFGPSWATFWFKISVVIPALWTNEEVLFHFDPDCEGLVWTTDGVPVQGITGTTGIERHIDYRLTKRAKGGEKFEFFIETACNGLFGNGNGIEAPDPNKTFKLKTAAAVVPNKLAFDLWWDFEILLGMAKELPEDSQANCDALYTANQIVNVLRRNDIESLKFASQIAKEFFAARKREGHAQHQITAVGNCHIDTAWLWPYDETKRKVARSFATQLRLMEDYPEYCFTHSQAQQFEWCEKLYPDIFKEVVAKAASGQFAPIGGTWVEMDCNVPSGEALCRQFLYGQQYFESKFGKRCRVFWLPDTFGYSAQLPQIVKSADMKYFFTQKLSWNLINKFPHSTFWWTGLDGTSVLTHFSPADTYVAQGSVKDVVFCVKNNKDKEYSNRSLILYGNGDGGGGPLLPMIERLKRMQNVDGLPANVKFGNPTDFFDDLEKNGKDIVTWKGELYFELHRGTYTTHAAIKKMNRQAEYMLRRLEILAVLTQLHGASVSYPKVEIDGMWKNVLLNQFHDVLPGSSIEAVYVDAKKIYEEVFEQGGQLEKGLLSSLLRYYDQPSPKNARVTFPVINITSWPVAAEVIELDAIAADSALQISASGKALGYVSNILPFSITSVNVSVEPESLNPVSVYSNRRETVAENAFIQLTINADGHISSFFDKVNRREIIQPGKVGNCFKLFEDIPLYWDAWDVEIYHLEKGWNATPAHQIKIMESGPLRVIISAEHQITPTSRMTQSIIITAGSPRVDFDTLIDWNESRVIMKVEFPLNINSDVVTFETQFGIIQRPTHYNNSWDLARFEVCGHKFADVSEFGYGVALLNDSKYGYSCKGNILRMSLVRASKAPDANADIGHHRFKYALYPHKRMFHESDVVEMAYQFNVPPVLMNQDAGASINVNFFSISERNVVLDTVKLAENPRTNLPGTIDVVLRFYEAYGGRGEFKIESIFKIIEARHCNIMEDIGTPIDLDGGNCMVLAYTPFKIISLRVLLQLLRSN